MDGGFSFVQCAPQAEVFQPRGGRVKITDVNAPCHDKTRPARLAACWEANQAPDVVHAQLAELRRRELENLREENRILIKLIQCHALRLGVKVPVVAVPEFIYDVGL
jgi:hypothetical protein